MPRIPIWREARDIIVPIISENTALKLLYHHALNDGGMAFDLFEHRFRELLRQYCSDLKAEANDIPRKEAVKVLKLSTDKIVYEIHELCGPADHVSKERLALLKQQKAKKHEEVEQYLRKTVGLSYDKPGPEATDERVDDMEADESDPDDDRVSEHLFPNIHTIKTFFVSGTPFTRLHENLHDFVFPSQETKKDVDSSTEKVQFPPKPEIDKALWKDYRQSMPQLGMYDLLVASLQYLSQYLNNSMQAWTNDHFKVSQVQSFIHELRMKVRPSVIAGHQRITWRCGCGKHMYADVEELYPGGAESLQTSLRRAAADAIWIDNQLAHDTFTNLGINTELIQLTTNSTRSHHQSSNNNSRSSQISTGMSTSTETLHGPVLSTSSTSTTLAGTDLSLSSSGETISDQPQATLQQQFLLLCISTPRTAKLEQIRIPYSADDQVMFQDIRRAYLKVRQTRTQTFHPETPDFIRRLITKGYVLLHLTQKITIQLFHFLRLRWLVWWIGDLVFYIPTSANFVRFELIPIKTEICPEVLSFPDLPPSEEVHVKKTYHYTPCPQSVRNPVLRIPYLHVLFEPGNHLDRFWSNRVPKKLNSEIRYGDGVEPVIGWGVHVVEGPNWVAFSVLSEIVLLLSGVLALGWSLLARDVSAGFTVGAYVVAVLAVGNALGIVMLCQQH
ncbi:hypothetical protein MMC18_007958 [Xylographa bjoerkii]|nr:hypothetical protein [Xylographa bjoerkii]